MQALLSLKKKLSLSVLYYLRWCARWQLKKNHPLVIGITGTAGKSSTMHAIDAVLQDHFLVKASYKANSESGLPLNILGLSLSNYGLVDWLRVIVLALWQLISYWPRHQIYLAEMAIDSPFSPRNMSYLLSILQPTIGVFLNAGSVHGDNFDNLATSTQPKKRKQEIIKLIAYEKGKMIQSLPENGLAVLSLDDPNVIAFRHLTQAPVLTFGNSASASVYFQNCQQSLKGTEFNFLINGKRHQLYFSSYLLPHHYGSSLAAAIAVGTYFKLTPDQIINSLKTHYVLPPGRSSLIAGFNHSFILDSSYNSSLQPLTDSLQLLSSVAPHRKIVLLGDMRELGTQTESEHQQLAPLIIKHSNLAILVGPNMKKFVLPELEKNHHPCRWFKTSFEAGTWLRPQLKSQDMVLIKGSQNQLLLETAVELLMANPTQAESLLCRRGSYWQHQRQLLQTNH